jgi:hypothetical protein
VQSKNALSVSGVLYGRAVIQQCFIVIRLIYVMYFAKIIPGWGFFVDAKHPLIEFLSGVKTKFILTKKH